jgi:pimeloyl-ACP methyl ester carboxylesterase
MPMVSRYLSGLSRTGFHRLHYVEWGKSSARRVVVCVHGLTRNARDFDKLAQALEKAEFRIICPDIAGRGGSDWLASVDGYSYEQYLADVTALIARLNVEQVDWVGTSMGGLIGLLLAAQARTPIRGLVLNDVGPYIAQPALQRIAGYVSEAPYFATLDEAEQYLRRVHQPFGPLSDNEWHHMTEHSTRRVEDGGYRLHYDPAIGQAFNKEPVKELNWWPIWDAIRCPVLVLRGAQSDVLSAQTAREMTRRGPRAKVETFAGIGHAPALFSAEQVNLLCEWLRKI